MHLMLFAIFATVIILAEMYFTREPDYRLETGTGYDYRWKRSFFRTSFFSFLSLIFLLSLSPNQTKDLPNGRSFVLRAGQKEGCRSTSAAFRNNEIRVSPVVVRRGFAGFTKNQKSGGLAEYICFREKRMIGCEKMWWMEQNRGVLCGSAVFQQSQEFKRNTVWVLLN